MGSKKLSGSAKGYLILRQRQMCIRDRSDSSVAGCGFLGNL